MKRHTIYCVSTLMVFQAYGLTEADITKMVDDAQSTINQLTPPLSTLKSDFTALQQTLNNQIGQTKQYTDTEAQAKQSIEKAKQDISTQHDIMAKAIGALPSSASTPLNTALSALKDAYNTMIQDSSNLFQDIERLYNNGGTNAKKLADSITIAINTTLPNATQKANDTVTALDGVKSKAASLATPAAGAKPAGK